MGKILLDEKPLLILPSLATKIGLNESIVLQQIHYWLKDSKHIHEGRKWTYGSYPEWQKQFSWWSVKTVQRVFNELEKKRLIISGNFNKKTYDRTKWYTINYEALKQLEDCPVDTPDIPSGQNDQMDQDNLTSPSGQNDQMDQDNLTSPIPKTYTKTSTETYTNIYTSEFLTFWECYPRQIEKKAAFRCWNARLKEKVPAGDMIIAAKNYAIYCKNNKVEMRYRKHPSTFLGPDKHYEEFISGPPEPDPTDPDDGLTPSQRHLKALRESMIEI